MLVVRACAGQGNVVRILADLLSENPDLETTRTFAWLPDLLPHSAESAEPASASGGRYLAATWRARGGVAGSGHTQGSSPADVAVLTPLVLQYDAPLILCQRCRCLGATNTAHGAVPLQDASGAVKGDGGEAGANGSEEEEEEEDEALGYKDPWPMRRAFYMKALKGSQGSRRWRHDQGPAEVSQGHVCLAHGTGWGCSAGGGCVARHAKMACDCCSVRSMSAHADVECYPSATKCKGQAWHGSRREVAALGEMGMRRRLGLRKGHVVQLQGKGWFVVDTVPEVGSLASDVHHLSEDDQHPHPRPSRQHLPLVPGQGPLQGGACRPEGSDEDCDKEAHLTAGGWCDGGGLGQDRGEESGFEPQAVQRDAVGSAEPASRAGAALRLVAIPSGMVVRRYTCCACDRHGDGDSSTSQDYDDSAVSVSSV